MAKIKLCTFDMYLYGTPSRRIQNGIPGSYMDAVFDKRLAHAEIRTSLPTQFHQGRLTTAPKLVEFV